MQSMVVTHNKITKKYTFPLFLYKNTILDTLSSYIYYSMFEFIRFLDFKTIYSNRHNKLNLNMYIKYYIIYLTLLIIHIINSLYTFNNKIKLKNKLNC